MTIVFDRPLIVLSAPRSGSTLLFEALATAPALYTIGGESHRAIEGVPALRVDHHAWSNRLAAADATPGVRDEVLARFASMLRDRDGQAPATERVRLLEKTPKNCLRIPFLLALFPDARFIVLQRDPRAVLASMIDAWRSGRFVTYPHLPGWPGPPWSLLLTPGWQSLATHPLEAIVAAQWATTVDTMLDDLAPLDRSRIAMVRYETLVAAPDAELRRLAAFGELGWDRNVASLPLSRHTLTPPDPEKWRRHEAMIERVMPSIAATVARLESFF